MELTDNELVEKVRAGEDDAFRILVERHSRPIYRSAFRITGNAADADDVVQEAFLRCYRALASFDARATFPTWLNRIAINCALDLIDSRKRREGRIDGGEDLAQLASPDASPDRLLLGSEMQRAIAAAMAELTGNERTAFVLRHFEGMPLEEIGQILGTRLNATKNTVFRAVRKLRQQLQPFTGSLV
ncbi:MAG TPA: sigma-70 family RNA polymerase sigma factor [Thermoanaerobaculia bacterium]|jgi:RNA polymerase sigma-70 factor (ECF subfamily)